MTTNKEDIKGYLIETEGRSLFMREREQVEWALEDDRYTVTPLIGKPQFYEQHIVEDGKSSPEFDAYKELAEDLYRIQQEQLSSTKTMLEDAIELIEGIGELSAKKTENLMEMRGLLALIAQDCKKFLAPSDGE